MQSRLLLLMKLWIVFPRYSRFPKYDIGKIAFSQSQTPTLSLEFIKYVQNTQEYMIDSSSIEAVHHIYKRATLLGDNSWICQAVCFAAVLQYGLILSHKISTFILMFSLKKNSFNYIIIIAEIGHNCIISQL